MNKKIKLSYSTVKPKLKNLTHLPKNEEALFNELIERFLATEYRISQQTATTLCQLGVKHPQLIAPHVKRLLLSLKDPSLPIAVIRNTLRLLQYAQIPKQQHNYTINSCFAFLNSSKTPIAIKAFAMTVAANICLNYPDLREELKLMVEDLMPCGSPGIVSRGKKILVKLNGKTI